MKTEFDFNEVYETFQPKILNYMSQLIGRHEAEDITQEVFAKVSRGLKNFKGASKLSTWLYRIATNTAIDRMRSVSFQHSPDHTSLEDDMDLEDRNAWSDQVKTSTDQTLIRKEMSACIREFIGRLPSDYKTALLLSEIEGFKNKEIAEILQVSLETVKTRLHRARARLRQELDDGCIFYRNEHNILACDRKPVSIISKKSS